MILLMLHYYQVHFDRNIFKNVLKSVFKNECSFLNHETTKCRSFLSIYIKHDWYENFYWIFIKKLKIHNIQK